MAKRKRAETRSPEELRAEAKRLVGASAVEMLPSFLHDHRGKLVKSPAATAILGETPELQLEALRVAWCFVGGEEPELWELVCPAIEAEGTTPASWLRVGLVRELINRLFRKKPACTVEDYAEFIRLGRAVRSHGKHFDTRFLAWSALFTALRKHVDGGAKLGRTLRAELSAATKLFSNWESDERKLKDRIKALLEAAKTQPEKKATDAEPEAEGWTLPPGVTAKVPWVAELEQAVSGLSPTAQAGWGRLLAHCAGAKASKPSAKWIRIARKLLRELDPASTARLAMQAAQTAIQEPPRRMKLGRFNALTHRLPEPEQHLLKGLTWLGAYLPRDEVIGPLGDVAAAGLRKVPGHGTRNAALGNACLWVLCTLGGQDAVGQVVRVKQRIKNRSVLKQIERNLARAAAAAGLSPVDLEELSVPSFGLSEVGRGERTLGEHRALLRVTDSSAALTWHRPDGKEQKSVPAALKHERPEAIKELRRQHKDLGAMLGAQRLRLDRLLAGERSWTLTDWRLRFLDHPLVGTLARRIIWELAGPAGWCAVLWAGDALRDLEGRPAPASDRVRLWHPARSSGAVASAWQARLDELGLTQPFQQAHRDCYTAPADDVHRSRTAIFAGTILRQHVLNALARERGWQMRLFGRFDGGDPPSRRLSAWGVHARLELELGDRWQEETSEAGIYLAVTSGELIFDRPLDELPPVALSEVFRDVDLFCSVAGIGHDPTWAQRAGEGPWRAASFGELTQVDRTRRAVIAALLPRLSFGERCDLGERFLDVRGPEGSYRIHLGSAQVLRRGTDALVLLDPSPRRRAPREALALPFEGDATLSLILAKARRLAQEG